MCWDIIDTEHFQRLRNLKQVGNAVYVYPSASHSRFEHSLGVCHLAQVSITQCSTQKDLDVSKNDIQLVSIAGLVHDLGHGPFSHVFDAFLGKYSSKSHEDRSIILFDDLISKYEIDLTEYDIKRISAMIKGDVLDRKFLYQIVCNAQNSLDVDKFDYLERDCSSLGDIFSTRRIMDLSRVINDEICYNSKVKFDILDLFRHRADNFRNIYYHKTARAIDFMLIDALELAEKELEISDRCIEASTFLKLNDSIINEINSNDNLIEANALLKRIRDRKLYKLAHQVIVTEYLPITSELVSKYGMIRKEHIRIDMLDINYANGNANPIDNVNFFHKYDMDCILPITIPSNMLPSVFQEIIIRAYCTNDDVINLKKAFLMCLKHLNVVYKEF